MSCPNRNLFCYVCSLYTPKANARNITKTMVAGFEKYFRISYIPNVLYVPEIVCEYCYRRLNAVQNGSEVNTMKYVRPTIWFAIDEHEVDSCYFCLSKRICSGYHYNQRETVAHADCENVLPAKKRTKDMPYSPMEIALQQQQQQQEADNPGNFDYSEGGASYVQTTGGTSEYLPPASHIPHLITQKDFNDLVRDSFMSQRSAEIWASRLSQWNLVASDFRITAARKRGNAVEFDQCFAVHEVSKILYMATISIHCLIASV